MTPDDGAANGMAGRYFKPEPDAKTYLWNGREHYHIRDDVYFYLFNFRGKLRRRYTIKTSCDGCGDTIYADRGNRRKNKQVLCSESCRSALFSGKGATNWKGGRRSKHGNAGDHILVYAPDHPNACRNFVPEHRLVVEKSIGRILDKNEFVHHIDCDPTNNRIDNLVIVSQTQHHKAHGSLNRCVKELLTTEGRLFFDREALVYRVKAGAFIMKITA